MQGGPKKPAGTPKGRIILQPLQKPESAAAAPQKLDTTTPGHVVISREVTDRPPSHSSNDSDSSPSNSPTSVQSPRDGREPPHITHSNSSSPLSSQVSPLVLPDGAEEYLSGAAAPPNTYREASPNLPPVRQPNPSNAAAAENPLQAKLKLGAEIAARKTPLRGLGLTSKKPGTPLAPLTGAPQAASAAASAAGAQPQAKQKNAAGAQLQPLKDAPQPETTASRIAKIVAEAGVQPISNAQSAGPQKEDLTTKMRKPTATGYRAHGPLAPLNTGKPPAEKKADAVNPLDKHRKPLGK